MDCSSLRKKNSCTCYIIRDNCSMYKVYMLKNTVSSSKQTSKASCQLAILCCTLHIYNNISTYNSLLQNTFIAQCCVLQLTCLVPTHLHKSISRYSCVVFCLATAVCVRFKPCSIVWGRGTSVTHL